MKIACIGCGVMGSAFMSAIAKKVSPADITVSDKFIESANAFAKKTGCNVGTNCEAVKGAKYIFLAVKPAFVKEVLEDVKDCLEKDSIIISMAAGISLDFLESNIPSQRFIRIMPNMPAQISEGMTALCYKCDISESELAEVISLIEATGKVEVVDEKLMDCVTAVSGSGPAYAFMFIEAMADAAVKLGMPRKQAYTYAAQTLKGAATMALQDERNPAALKDAVCSPGGTTIEAVAALEKYGFRNAVIEAVTAAHDKSVAMGKK